MQSIFCAEELIQVLNKEGLWCDILMEPKDLDSTSTADKIEIGRHIINIETQKNKERETSRDAYRSILGQCSNSVRDYTKTHDI